MAPPSALGPPVELPARVVVSTVSSAASEWIAPPPAPDAPRVWLSVSWLSVIVAVTLVLRNRAPPAALVASLRSKVEPVTSRSPKAWMAPPPVRVESSFRTRFSVNVLSSTTSVVAEATCTAPPRPSLIVFP